jgi:hypothetical protein
MMNWKGFGRKSSWHNSCTISAFSRGTVKIHEKPVTIPDVPGRGEFEPHEKDAATLSR